MLSLICTGNKKCQQEEFVLLGTTTNKMFFLTVFPTQTSTNSASSNEEPSQRTKVIVGCIGAILGLAVIAMMFFLVWRKRGLKHHGLPIILQESNLLNEGQDSVPPLQIKQQNGQLAVTQGDSAAIRKRNSSYRSQLSSAASAGTVITFAEGML